MQEPNVLDVRVVQKRADLGLQRGRELGDRLMLRDGAPRVDGPLHVPPQRHAHGLRQPVRDGHFVDVGERHRRLLLMWRGARERAGDPRDDARPEHGRDEAEQARADELDDRARIDGDVLDCRDIARVVDTCTTQ